MEAAQALPVDLASTAAPIANMRRRFTFAMKTLALTPSVHPSQKHASLVSANKLKMCKGDERNDGERKNEEATKNEPGKAPDEMTPLPHSRAWTNVVKKMF